MNPWLEKSVLSFVGVVFMIMVAGTAADEILHGKNDFAPLYNGTQLVGTPHLYSVEHNFDLLEKHVGGVNESLRYTRLPYLAVLLWPLGQLPYQTAYVVWSLLSLSALVAFVALWRIPSGPEAMMFTAFSLPAAQAVMNGQDVPYLLLWIALAVYWERKGKPLAAGLILTLCAAKFHLFTLIPVLLIAQSRWRMLKGFLGGGLALLAISFAVQGVRWPVEYFHTLTDGRVHPNVAIMPNLHGLFYGLPGGVALEIAASIAVVVTAGIVARRASFLYGMAVALTGGLLISYHSYMSDCALLLPAGTVIYAQIHGRWMRLVTALLLTPFIYFLLITPDPAPYVVRFLIIGLFAGAAAHVLRAPAAQQAEALEPA